jgi:hypothetical protein
VREEQEAEVHRDALVDEQVRQVEDLVQQEEEREDEQPEEEGNDQLFPDVAIENPHVEPFYERAGPV